MGGKRSETKYWCNWYVLLTEDGNGIKEARIYLYWKVWKIRVPHPNYKQIQEK